MNAILAILTGAMLAHGATAWAAPTAQQKCDSARILAWKRYVGCVQSKFAKDYRGGSVDEYAPLEKCRRSFFKKWTDFQSRPSLATTACAGSRFVDNGDGTVTDNLTMLVWEKKTNRDSMPNYADPHDADNFYSWSTGSPYSESGTAFTDFLAALNGGAGFGGANGWRLPTAIEQQTILAPFSCPSDGGSCYCAINPCLAFSDATQDNVYFSATSYLPDRSFAWYLNFGGGDISHYLGYKVATVYFRAVRGGL